MPVLPSARRYEPPPSGREWWVGGLTFLIPTGLLFVVGWLVWQPVPVGVWHDDGAYLLIAESLAHGGGLSWFGVSGTPPAAKFPPLYPALLSLLVRSGVEPESGARAFALLNTMLLALSGGLFALFLRRVLAIGAVWAGGVATLVWIAPDLWALAAIPLSEPLFLVGLTAGLLASLRLDGLDPVPETEPDPMKSEEVPGRASGVPPALPGFDFLAAFALTFYARTVGIALVVGAVAASLLRRRWRRAAWLAGCALLIVLPWVVWSSSATGRIPEPMRDVLGGYGGWLLGEIARDPVSFVASALANGWSSWGGLSAMLVPGVPDIGIVRGGVALAMAALMVQGLLRLAKRSPSAAFVLLAYGAIVAVWPFQADRLVAPAIPLAALCVFLGLRLEPRGRPAQRTARVALVGLGAVLAMNYAAHSATALATGSYLAPYQLRAEGLVGAVEAVERFTPPGSVVGAPELWSGLQIHGNRVVAPTARFLPLATDGPSWGTPEQQYALWEATGVDYIVVEHAGGVHGAALDQLDAACPGGAVQLVATLPTGFLVRLAWDSDCRARVLP